MSIFRMIAISVILSLSLINAYLVGWNDGFEPGYGEGVSDVVLGIVTPHDYFVKKGILRETRNSRK